MEIKKSPKANLEDKRFTFVLMGLVAALCILYTAFEWNQQEITVHEAVNEDFLVEEEIQIDQTFQEETPPPPPAPDSEPLEAPPPPPAPWQVAIILILKMV